jgi:hypothetical protein
MRSLKDSNFLFRQLQATWENAAVVAPIIVGASLFIGTIFYQFVNGWDLALSYFFAATVLFGDMYLVPTEPNPWSHVFTLFYFLWGTTLLAGAITSAANMVVNSAVRIAAEERKRIFATTTGVGLEENVDEEVAGYLARLYNYFQWAKYRSKYTALFFASLWIGLGTCYALLYEEWPLAESVLFAIAAVSTAGSIPPPCEGADATNCTIGTFRALFIGTYIVIGVPIFAYTVGQFAEILVERAIKSNEMKLMARPLTPQEFRFAFELHRGEIVVDSASSVDDEEGHLLYSRSLNESVNEDIDREHFETSQPEVSFLSMRKAFRRQKSWRGNSKPHAIRLTLEDFIILEMLRLQKITSADLHYIKMLFDSLDEDGDGVILSPEEGVHFSRDTSAVSNDGVQFGSDSYELLSNTAQKLSRSSSRNIRPPPSPLTSSFMHPTMTTYGSLYAIPENSELSERGGLDKSSDGNSGIEFPHLIFPAGKLNGSTNREFSSDDDDNQQEEVVTVVDDQEALEALQSSTLSPTISDKAQPPSLAPSESRTTRSISRASSRTDGLPITSTAGTPRMSRQSSRSNSRANALEMQYSNSEPANRSVMEDDNFISPIHPVSNRQRSSPSPTARWGNELFVNGHTATEENPILNENQEETKDGASSGLEKISSQYNKLILSRLNKLNRQASHSNATVNMGENEEKSADVSHAEDQSESLWGSVLSSVKGLVRVKRAVSESAIPTPYVIQLAPFKSQPAGKRRLSLSSDAPSSRLPVPEYHLPTIEEESSNNSRDRSQRAMSLSAKKGTLHERNAGEKEMDWSIGDWIDVERGRSIQATPKPQDSSEAALNEVTPLLPKSS